MYTPEFGDKYKLEVIVDDNKENDVIKIIRANSKMGKFLSGQLHVQLTSNQVRKMNRQFR